MFAKKFLAATAAVCMMGAAFAAEKPATEGAELGKWTMDAPAAQALAKEKGKPLFVNFTGSDWCGWCKLMDGKVFSQKAWQDYAAGELVLLWVDFPKDKGLVPEKFVKQNDELAEKYGVSGYPTYVVLGPDGRELGRLGADREATPEKFIGQLKDVLIAQSIEKWLDAAQLAAYRAAEKARDAAKAKAEAIQKELMDEAMKLQQEFQTRAKALQDKYEPQFKPIKEAMDKATETLDGLKAKAREAAAKK